MRQSHREDRANRAAPADELVEAAYGIFFGSSRVELPGNRGRVCLLHSEVVGETAALENVRVHSAVAGQDVGGLEELIGVDV